jgi:hypothetical protein
LKNQGRHGKKTKNLRLRANTQFLNLPIPVGIRVDTHAQDESIGLKIDLFGSNQTNTPFPLMRSDTG